MPERRFQTSSTPKSMEKGKTLRSTKTGRFGRSRAQFATDGVPVTGKQSFRGDFDMKANQN